MKLKSLKSLRVSVVSFNNDAREIFSFSKYDRLNNVQVALEKAIDQMIFDDATTDYNAAFDRIEAIYRTSFRKDSQVLRFFDSRDFDNRKSSAQW